MSTEARQRRGAGEAQSDVGESKESVAVHTRSDGENYCG